MSYSQVPRLLNRVQIFFSKLSYSSQLLTIFDSFSFRNCYQNYLDFYRCQNIRGESYEPCQFFKKSFETICPNDWIERWDGQREAGTFPSDLTK